MSQLSIVLSKSRHCSGKCAFCSACSMMTFAQGYQDLKAIDDVLYNEIVFDFNKLEETLTKHPKWPTCSTIQIWGNDPLTSFQSFQELFDFIKYLEKKYNKHFKVWASTNGLPLTRDDVAEYVAKNNIKLQLSHDGIANYFRTADVEVLDNQNVIDLLKKNITCIGCIHSFYNYQPLTNYHWFKNKLGDKTPHLRLWTIHDGEYDTQVKNVRGLINGKEYAALKGVPFGDYMIRNDYEMAAKYNLPFLAHVADDFFAQYMKLYVDIDKYPEAKSVLLNRMIDSVGPVQRPLCAQYHLGLSEYSDVIDTEGYYTECHLLDHYEHAQNKKLEKPKECHTCKFGYNNTECGLCGSLKQRQTVCQFNYRLLNMYQVLWNIPYLKEEINNGKW